MPVVGMVQAAVGMDLVVGHRLVAGRENLPGEGVDLW